MSWNCMGFAQPPEPDCEEENFLAYLEDNGLTVEDFIKQQEKYEEEKYEL